MKWVLLGLYSDSYTTPDVMFFHTEADVLKFISDTCTEWEEPRVEIGYVDQSSFSNEEHMRVTIDDDCGNFYVCEVFPIKKTTNYIAIEYHAYEGVDFKRTECITEEEAREVIDKSFNEIIEDDVYEIVDQDRDESSYLIDDNYEWHIGDIYKVPVE